MSLIFHLSAFILEWIFLSIFVDRQLNESLIAAFSDLIAAFSDLIDSFSDLIDSFSDLIDSFSTLDASSLSVRSLLSSFAA